MRRSIRGPIFPSRCLGCTIEFHRFTRPVGRLYTDEDPSFRAETWESMHNLLNLATMRPCDWLITLSCSVERVAMSKASEASVSFDTTPLDDNVSRIAH